MASLVQGAVRDTYKMAFELSPIILTGGLLSNLPISELPIITVLQSLTLGSSLISGLLSASANPITDMNAFAHFRPLAGSTLVSNTLAAYPFANQVVAANAAITQPLGVALAMTAPAQGDFGYALKTATMLALKMTLDGHMASGGLFTVLTPSYIYTDCVLLDLRDSTSGQSNQAQTEWTWTFTQPQVQVSALDNVLNNLMSKIDGGLPSNGLWSSITTSIGNAENAVSSGLESVIGL